MQILRHAASSARSHGIEPAPGTAILDVVVLKPGGQQREPVAAKVEAEVRTRLEDAAIVR